MAINVVGFKWNGSDENHKYDYEALENLPITDIGSLALDITADAGTDDGDLYRAIQSFPSWNVIDEQVVPGYKVGAISVKDGVLIIDTEGA